MIDPLFRGEIGELVGRVHPRTGQATADNHSDISGGMATHELANTAQQYLRPLQPLQPTNEQNDLSVQRDAQLTTGPLGGTIAARRKELHVHPGRHDIDAPRVGIVEIRELLSFGICIDDEPARIVHNLLLADTTGLRLWRIPLRQMEVLHRRQRVRRVHKRNIKQIRQQPPHLAREPVVRMNQVVFNPLFAGELNNPASKSRHLRSQV